MVVSLRDPVELANQVESEAVISRLRSAWNLNGVGLEASHEGFI